MTKTAKTEDSDIPEIRIEDFCDSPDNEEVSQGGEGNTEQNLQEDQVFRDLCKMSLAGCYSVLLHIMLCIKT